MIVTLVIGRYDAYGGGAERWTDQHARMLLAEGHEVHLVSHEFRNAPDRAICHVVPVRRPKRRPRIQFGLDAADVVDRLPSDVVHDMGDGWHCDLFMPHHGTRRGTFKFNIRYRPPLEQWWRRLGNRTLPRYREFRALERRQYDCTDGKLCLAVSKMIGAHMRKFCKVARENVRVVHNGVDTTAFRPLADPKERSELRRRLGVADEIVFLIVAHDFRRKGLDTLLAAMGPLARIDSRVRLLVVGAGRISRYQALARTLGCAHVVRFLGDKTHPMAYYQAADVFVLPTLYDPCSLVVLEAMAVGLPTITSSKNGVKELMTRGREGLIVQDPGDPEELVAAMAAYLDPERRAMASLAARALAETRTLRHVYDDHLRVYAEILQRRAGRS